MTKARRDLVDPSVTRWYHCISRCVRAALLLANGREDRKEWLERRLQFLTENFALSVGGFAVLDNHLHVLCRLDPEAAKKWTAEDVVRRWIKVYPPSSLDMDDVSAVDEWVKRQASDVPRVEKLRIRLADLGWFMKALKEPLARLANREDGYRGPFWEPRYKSIAILDDEALLATSAYIDLNVVAAGLAEVPEKSPHTSVKQRVDHVRDNGRLDKLRAALEGSVAASERAGDMEQGHWLVPVEDRRSREPSSREGMLESLPLGSYLLLVESIGRRVRTGKASIDSALRGIFQRLDIIADRWGERVEQLLKPSGALRGNFFASGGGLICIQIQGRDTRVVSL